MGWASILPTLCPVLVRRYIRRAMVAVLTVIGGAGALVSSAPGDVGGDLVGPVPGDVGCAGLAEPGRAGS